MSERRRIRVEGIVQGVGFRPFVYTLARRGNLAGYVLNDGGGVTIEAEGEPPRLNEFLAALQAEAPPLALIERVTAETIQQQATTPDFTIAASRSGPGGHTLVSPDVATCADCRRELFDPHDRRYHYPFINCTHCGPRYTITQALPYDRPLTTMAPFTMCADCQREYDDPADRRFHAQPNACPACGPQLTLDLCRPVADLLPDAAPLAQAQRLLARGAIVAIKGLGGYHLAGDATNAATVRHLRQVKHRWGKPLALMAADLAAVAAICELSDAERNSLAGRQRPIVLLRRRPNIPIAEEVAPGQKTLGVMLPYTPLHELLFAAGSAVAEPCPFLVMTSANVSDEPIVYRREDAQNRLASLADAILTHNRAIHTRCDDSVVRLVRGVALPLRRSRGFAPQPLSLPLAAAEPLLAVGGHLKNSICLVKGRHALLSHHIGDLDNLAGRLAFREAVDHLQNLFATTPAVVAHDMHPDYATTRYALDLPGVTPVAVQHHHAHIASVLAEHGLAGPVIGVAFDGSGYGSDGAIWGGEFLVATLAGFSRAAHLQPLVLPGGEQAILQPWRVAAAWLYRHYDEKWLQWPLPFARRLDRQTWGVLRHMIDRDLNCPATSSMGRLFDAVAALIGVRDRVHYEGQAAIELENMAAAGVAEAYPFARNGSILDPAPILAAVLSDLLAGLPTPIIAARFHNGVSRMIAAVCAWLRREHGLNQVALSGGVFQNALLLARSREQLEQAGFEVYTNRQVPPNDGGLCLGQAAVALAQQYQDGRD